MSFKKAFKIARELASLISLGSELKGKSSRSKNKICFIYFEHADYGNADPVVNKAPNSTNKSISVVLTQ